MPATQTISKNNKFRTVLGLSTLSDNSDPVLITTTANGSVNGVRQSVTDQAIYSHDSPRSSSSSLVVEEMNIDLANVPTHPQQVPRSAMRITQQWGPWSISAAETPHNARLYTLYIKTPTHNLTLLRSPKEITELHTKLRDLFPTTTLPQLPQFPLIAQPGQKRRGSFLHTLSRFAPNSPKPKSTGSRPTSAVPSSPPPVIPALPTPAASPSFTSPPLAEDPDPFGPTPSLMLIDPQLPASYSTPSHQPNPVSVTTSLGKYLTSLANDNKIRNSRPWKRFVRVRADDLQSVRVERAIKRVRSDLAMHTSPSLANGIGSSPSTTAIGVGPASMMSLAMGGFMLTGDQSERESEASGSKYNIASEPVRPELHEDPGTTHKEVTDKRISAVSAMNDLPSAFSSDSGIVDGVGSSPSTPTPADIPLPPVSPEELGGDVTANYSTRATEDDNMERVENLEDSIVDTGLPTPVQSPPHNKEPSTQTTRIVRSASADPERRRTFKPSHPSPLNLDALGSETADEDSVDGRASSGNQKGEEPSTDVDARSSTTNDEGEKAKKPKKVKKVKSPPKKVCVDDFDMMRVLGKGCAGKVLLVKYKKTGGLYALKAITKRHVLAHQELQHTLTEQAVLKRMSRGNRDPFVVKLWWSFHDKDNLFLVMDFHPGGDLATQLARWGRLGRDRARFYAAEIVEGVEGLHAAGVVYRDLKPENILIGADGHIVLTDFGLSKEFPRRNPITGTITPSGNGSDFYSSTAPGTPNLPHWMEKGGEFPLGNAAGVGAVGHGHGPGSSWSSQKDTTTTFCGTAEYLAPEVIQGLPYSFEVDWWSFGTMLYEMLSGITPFWANNHSDMYVRVLQDELQFPDDRAMDHDTKSLIRGLLQRNPALRMSEPRIKRHPYFSMIDWEHVYYKRYIPPYIPPIDPTNASDTQNFDEAFLEMNPVIDNDEEDGVTDSERGKTEDEGARTDGEGESERAPDSTNGTTAPSSKMTDGPKKDFVDVFDGYSFKGRQSIMLDDDDDEGYAGTDEDEDEELADAKKYTDALAAMHEQQPTDETISEGPKEDGAETRTIDMPPTETMGSIPPEDSEKASSLAPTMPESISTEVTGGADVEPSPVTAITATNSTITTSKQGSQFSETPSTLFTTNTAVTTPSGELAESPISAMKADGEAHGDDVYDALRAPLPLSPVLEAVDGTSEVHLRDSVEVHPLESPAVKPKKEVSVIEPVSDTSTDVKKPKASAAPSTPTKRGRKEKSGVHALDRLRQSTEDDDMTEREDDDWDMVETPHGEEKNGAKGASLWQRGVVDRYRLAVFRKSGPNQPAARNANRPGSIAMPSSSSHEATPSPVPSARTENNADVTSSPSPSETKHKRGRTAVLSLRKSTRQFLRAKSPSGTFSSNSNGPSRISLGQSAAVLSSNNVGLLTPSPSGAVQQGQAAQSHGTRSLKSKSSALSKNSMGSPGSSDQSNVDLRGLTVTTTGTKSAVDVSTPVKTPMSPRDLKTPTRAFDDSDKHKNLKKMKKHTEQAAEKMFSLFGSPRHHQHVQH
ncbi:hypothetical protein FRC02_011767 [Tulasnella sp. 418]|nr:hypothetical protein FRC02_011767 [Tulasnella sp. 418]